MRPVVVRNFRVSVHAEFVRIQNDTRAYVFDVWFTMVTVR
jgi:hypothetical protein